jgi:hypothetical protein
VSAGLGRAGRNNGTDLLHEFAGGGEWLGGPGGHDPVGDPAGELFLAPLTDDPDQFLFAVVVHHVRSCLPAAGVHPHIQRSVKGVGEAAFTLIELEGGNAEVHQDPVHLGNAEVSQDVFDFVIDGVDKVGARFKGRQPFTSQGKGFFITVDADQVQVGEALQHGLGVATHAERGINGHGGFTAASGRFESGRQQIDAPVPKDRHMAFGRGLRLIVHASSFLAVAVTWMLLGPDPHPRLPSLPAWLRGS